jgi:Tfp pilus assembly protein PilN
LIEVNLIPSGKKRASRGPRLSFKVPSVEAFPKDRWVFGSSLVIIVAVVLMGYLYFGNRSRLGDLTVAVEEAVSDSARYADLIEQNDALMARRDSIAQRVAIIQEIDGDRYVWPHVLDEVARALPDYTWLTEILQLSREPEVQFRIQGSAGNNFALTRFMTNLEASPFIRNVSLVSTQQTVASSGGVDRVVFSFMLEAFFERPPAELLQTQPLFENPVTGSDALISGH